MKTAIELIQEERQRQIEKGYTPEHDDEHDFSELSDAAACYAITDYQRKELNTIERLWPFEKESFRPSPDTPEGRLRELVKAASFLVADIDRRLRIINIEQANATINTQP